MKLDIVKLAKEAGFTTTTAQYPYEVVPIASPDQLQRFANLVLEEAAKVCDARYIDFMEPEIKEMAATIREMKSDQTR